MSIPLAHHVDALLLALASSTDNFTVGLSVGIRHGSLPLWANVVISVCNAFGAYAAGHGGAWLTVRPWVSESLPLYLAATAFGGLSAVEYRSYLKELASHQQDDNDIQSSMQEIRQVLSLAIPMTLNNLAGGVAGGAAGLAPEMTAMYALVASFVSMYVGFLVGTRFRRVIKGRPKGSSQPWLHPSLIAAMLLAVLCLLTLQEAMFG